MKTYNEWNRLQLTFSEKLTILQNRLYALSSAYATCSSVYPVSVGYIGGMTPPAAVDPAALVSEIDEIWSEMKSDVKEAKKKKAKAPKKAK